MKLYCNGLDLSELVDKYTWSGDDKQVARTLGFAIAKSGSDPNVPRVTLEAGDTVVMTTDDGKQLFLGVILKPDRTSSQSVVNYTAYDLMFYVNKSTGSWVIDEYAEDFARRVCAELGIKAGFIQETAVQVYSLAFNKTGYQAIMMAYTEAYRQNFGKYAYIPLMNGDELTVIPKGMDSEVVLETGEYGSLIDAKYSEDATGIVNLVIITDKDGNEVGRVENAESRAKYGTIQTVVTQEEGKDAASEAEALLKGIDRVASVTAISDYRAVSGWSLLIREPDTGLYGRYFIKSDKHTIAGGKATMDLTLEFESIMDEHELDNKEG